MSIGKTLCSCIPQRWITIFVCFFSLLVTYAMRICINIAITEMVVSLNETSEKSENNEYCPKINEQTPQINATTVNKELYEWSEYTQGIILSSYYWAYVISNFLGGEIALKFGGKHILGFAILSDTLFTLLTPITINWGGSTALICLRVIMGFGDGVVYPALSALMSQWVPENERSKAGSIVYSGASLGTIFGMTMTGIILKHYEGYWPMVFYFFGGVGCLSLALNSAFCYSEPVKNPFITDEEAEYLKENLKNTRGQLPPTPWGLILQSKPVWALVAAMVGHAWGFLTMASDMPKYMNSVLKFSVEDNGYFSSLPYLAFWIVSTIGSIIADSLTAGGYVSIERVRKTGVTVASMGPAIFLISASYAECNRILVVILLTIGVGLMGCSTFSIFINSLDLGPNYAGSLMGLVNGIATLTEVISPYLVGILTPEETIHEWRLVFWIVFGAFVLANSVYLIWGSGRLQTWNDPPLLTRQIKTNTHCDK